ncbi:YkvA family protein [Clostridium niameyense]|uniref:YkvA family protein n=1 Tax=Clostridium niameyense TaxID=1622073 RepID=UPI00067E81CB|nr:YkvA family protein [Clostridium niameyense]
MKLSSAEVKISSEDILSILKDFVKVEGLEFKGIVIDEFITVEGLYKNGMNILFKAKLGLGSIVDNILNVRIFKVEVCNLKILGGIKNLALKVLLKNFQEYGIYVHKDNIKIDLDTLSKKIPYVYFKIRKINVLNGFIEATVDNIIYSQDNKEKINSKVKTKKNYKLGYKKDNYSELRISFKNKLPKKYKKLFEYSMIVPDITVLLYRLFKDDRINTKNKALVAGILTYIVSPIDIIPSFIPFIGKIDDISIMFFGLNKIITEVPEQVIIDNWEGKDNIIVLVRDAVKYISSIVGTENIKKFIYAIDNIFKGFEQKKAKQSFQEVAVVNEKSNYIH